MAQRLDQELIERAGVRLAAQTQLDERQATIDDTHGECGVEDRLAKDVWHIAAAALRMPEDQLDPQENLANLGIDSIAITEVMVQISRHFGLSVAPTTFFEAKHLDDLSAILFTRNGSVIAAHYAKLDAVKGREPEPERISAPVAAQAVHTAPSVDGPLVNPDKGHEKWISRHRAVARAVTSSKPAERNPSAAADGPAAGPMDEFRNAPIAIVSMEGMFPQSPNLDIFEAHLVAGDDCIEEIPRDRWDWRSVYGDPKKGAFTDVKYGGFVSGVDLFDAGFFNISPGEAELIDPQHRLFMECVWSLIEKGGYAPGSLAGKKVSLFLGINLLDYTNMVNRAGIMEARQMTGLGHAFCPNRLSFLLDIHGPSEVVDTACSSSLVAIHRGVMSIRHEGCEMAIAGGSNLMLSPAQHIMFSKVEMIAKDGRCKTFSKDANGYARADGVGAVLLKRLDLAERDGDPILGVIRGSVAHHGGGATSLTAPNPKAQARLIIEAHEQAGGDPRSIGLIECHGTGTPLGDPIELEGLKLAFQELLRDKPLNRDEKPLIGLGSVKSNIGHAETAAGVAGLIKVLFAIKNRTLYQTLHCAEPNPLLELSGSPFYLLQEAAPWRRSVVGGTELPLRAGLSSFGAGGANVHLVIDEYVPNRQRPVAVPHNAIVVPVSAKSEVALAENIARLRKSAVGVDLSALAYTLQIGRDAMRYRTVFLPSDTDDLIRRMDAFLAGDEGAAVRGEIPPGRRAKSTMLDPTVKDARTIAAHWVVGGDVDWLALYGETKPYRVALPSYAFQRKRFWLPQEVKTGQMPGAFLCPAPDGKGRYALTLTGDEVFLTDHKVAGVPVLPGVAYLELARAAAEQDGFVNPTLSGVVWMTPLKVEQPVSVLCEVKRLDEMQGQLEIVSVSEQGTRTIHAQMRFASGGDNAVRTVDLEELRKAPSRHVDKTEVYASFDAMGLTYGPGHRIIADLWIRSGESGAMQVLTRLELPDDLCSTLTDCKLHPSLMDGALQSAIGLVLDGTGHARKSPALPFSVDGVEILGSCEERMWAHVRAGAVSGICLRKMDVDLIADDGSVRVLLRGFATRALETASDEVILHFEPNVRTVLVSSVVQDRHRRIVLLGAGTNTVDDLQAELPNADIRILDDDLTRPLAERYLGLAQQVLKTAQEELSKDRVLLQLVLKKDGGSAMHYGLAAMLRSIHREHPNVVGQVLSSIEGTDVAALAKHLRDAVVAPGGASLQAGEHGLSMDAWEEVASASQAPSLPWRDSSVYLITGGTGKLGQNLARDIIAKAPQAIVILASRNTPNPQTMDWLAANRNLHHICVDLSDQNAVADMVQAIRKDYGALDGVLHAAGVLRDAAFAKKTSKQVSEVFAPKVGGAMALDRAIGDAPLDFFVLYSSISAVVGNPGQADYAAANGFLDGFAEDREARRLRGECYGRTVSIAWPLWRDGGMGLDKAQEELMRRTTGLALLETRTGIDALYLALNGTSSRVLVAVGAGERIRRFIRSAFESDANVEQTSAASAEPPVKRGLEAPGTLHRLVLRSLVEETSAQLKVAEEDLEPDIELTEYGFDSIGFTQFANRLNARFDLELTPTLFFEYPTLEGLAGYLSEHETAALSAVLGGGLALEPNPDAFGQGLQTAKVPALKALAEEHFSAVGPQRQDDLIAIIGMSGQFPGAPTVDALWDVLKEGRSCFTEVPPDRWDWRQYWGDPMSEPGRGNVKWGGFIDGIAAFDASFFGISAPEARMMDPQQRLLLTESWRVMEDAGYAPSSLAGSQTGVFIGTADTGYSRLIAEANISIEGYSMTGLAPSLGPNRISYTYDFHGPSVAVETACSSALVAVHRAVEAIRSGHCTAAIAGGINTLLLPDAFVGFSKAGMLSPEGLCKPFSASADGYARGEGVGLVFLKPLKDAERDGDRVLAVIRSSAENHGGHAASLTAPNPKAQAELLRTAYARSGIDPRTISYIEAHGTGTPLGDPIEVEALVSAFADLSSTAQSNIGPAPEQSCAIGSIKSNIGHLELAAGIAGLIKVLLQIRHGEIAKTLHCDKLNPYLKLTGTPFHVAQQASAWNRPVDADGKVVPRRAGISSFGFGGSNAHVVLEEFQAHNDGKPSRAGADDSEIIVLSAKSEAQLKQSVEQTVAFLSGAAQGVALCDIAYTLQVAREPMEFRLGLSVKTKTDLLERLKAFLTNTRGAGIQTGSVKGNRKTMSALESDTMLREAAAGLVERGRAEDLLTLWVGGFTVDWKTVRHNRPGKRIALPGYPFAKTTYWVGQTSQVPSHTSAVQSFTTSTVFDGSESFLRDHKVNDAQVLPGVVSFELLRAALGRAGVGSGAFELIGHAWTEAVRIDAAPETLDVSLRAGPEQSFEYSITAKGTNGSRHHAQGVARPLGEQTEFQADLKAARTSADHELDVEALYRRFEDLGLRYGPAQRAITHLWQGQGIALARLSIPPEADRSPMLNPSILDGALQAVFGLDNGNADGLALPYSVRRVSIYGPTKDQMWAIIRAGDKGATIDVCDGDGSVKVRLEDYAVRRLETVNSASAAQPFEEGREEVRFARTLGIVTDIAARTLEVDPSMLDVETELGDFGFDSVSMTTFATRINVDLGLSLTPADFFEFATLTRLAHHISGDLTAEQLGLAGAAVENRAPRQDHIEDTQRSTAANAPEVDPIVIVGQSCCFPMAQDADEFWANLIDGRDCISRIPADRWSWQEMDGDPKQDSKKTNIHWGGFIDRVFEFDPLFFAISPLEARLMDPQQRLMLSHAWKAIEDAGHAPETLAGQKIGVFVGTSSSGYGDEVDGESRREGYIATGSVPSVGPNRISYVLDLHGPSEPVETACSSSLVALHRAVQAIKAGDCDMALVGGVNTIITPKGHINFAQAGMLSADGRCKTFSSKADGYVRGEGVGMLFVRRQSDAERDGDPILAVVRGTAINHGGHANSLTAPNTQAQADLLQTVYSKAGIDPRAVGYIEAHGTGTALGDPVEINALKSAFRALPKGEGQLDREACWLGSVKTNIGHLELAAGVAGIIKVLKQIEHRQLAPSLHCEEINPFIDLAGSPFQVVRDARPWKPVRDDNGNERPLTAGVSSFGFGGVNAHVVLEEYRPSPTRVPARAHPASNDPVVVVLSARDQARLKDNARVLLSRLQSGSFSNEDMSDLAYTLQVGRSEMTERLAIVVTEVDSLCAHLETFLTDGQAREIRRGQYQADKKPRNTLERNAAPLDIADHWVGGGKVDWQGITSDPHRRLRLSTYSFARDVYRIKGTTAQTIVRSEPATQREQGDFRIQLDAEAFYLRDHRVRGSRILPGAMSLEMVRRAICEKEALGDLSLRFSNITWRRPLALNVGQLNVLIPLHETAEGGWSFRLVEEGEGQGDYMRGEVRVAATAEPQHLDMTQLRETCVTAHDPDWLYAFYSALGIDYGATFRAITELTSGDDDVLARLQLPRATEKNGTDYFLHPSLMDAAFHAALVSFESEGGSALALPYGIEWMEILGPTSSAMWAHLRRRSSNEDMLKLDIDLADESGKVCVRIKGFLLRLLQKTDKPSSASKVQNATNDEPGDTAAERYFVDLIARETEIDASVISLSAPLEDYGIDSILIVRLTDELERDFGPLSRTLFFEYQTLGALVGYFLEAHAERLSAIVGTNSTVPPRALAAQAPTKTTRGLAASDEPIAIIGLAGRYPGARSVPEFWQNLAAGRDCVSEVPAERWDHSRYFDTFRQPGKTTSKWGGFVDGHDRFDPMFFNIAPREAALIDPQERLFLQCAWETLEDAGYTRATVAPKIDGLSGGDVGVFVGVMYEEYQLYGPERTAQGEPTALVGSPSSIANRVSYFCDFQGPSMAVDSMCSSSLTAIHLACDSLRSGSCSVALAGGVNLTVHPNKYVALSQSRFLSSKGRCKSFGEGGDGYVPAEGVGAVLLKPLSQAEADGDRVYGVILGSALNHGGKTNGYTVPNPAAQAAVIEAAMAKAGVCADDISYVEAHGTGTNLGDPIEISALTKVYRSQRKTNKDCSIGSVKSSIGHGESAAGIAGLTKLLLQLKHGQLAPSLHAETLNPNIDFETSPFKVQRRLEPWKREMVDGRALPRIASLSSFGAGGSNAHFVVSEYITEERAAISFGPSVFPFSARDPERLQALLVNFRSALEGLNDDDLPSAAFTLQEGREAFEERLALVADRKSDLVEKLDRLLAGRRDEEGAFWGSATQGLSGADLSPSAEKAAERWSQGGNVDWRALRQGPTPAPISLPTYPFAEEYCWLSEVEVDTPTPQVLRAPLPLLFVPHWEKREASPTRDHSVNRRVVILCGLAASQPRLAAQLDSSDAEVIVLETTDGFIDSRYGYYAARLLSLLQDVVKRRQRGTVVQVLVPSNGEDSLLQGLGGMLRCAALEHSNLSCQLVAVEGSGDNLVAKLSEDAGYAHEQNDIAYRQGRRLVRSWRESVPADDATQSPWKEKGVYLLTGGAGGVGLHVARAIAASGVKPTLWLTGRSTLKPEAHDTLQSLKALGATVHYRRVDMTDEAAVLCLLRDVEEAGGPLTGVFYGAGLTRDGLLVNKTETTLNEVLAPKVTGIRVLDDAIGNRPLDFMVLFASAAGALGNPGQSDYAAANAFLDRFAAVRNARADQGQRQGQTISIDWPYWRDGGMPMAARTMEAMEREAGVRPLETGSALAALTYILSSSKAEQVLVLEGDHDRLRELMAPSVPVAVPSIPVPSRPVPLDADAVTARQSEPVHAARRREQVVAAIMTCFANCLGMPKERLSTHDTIDRFGVDSITSLEIVEALSIEFGPLPDTILIECQTIDRLADELMTRQSALPPLATPQVAEQTKRHHSRNLDVAIIAVAGRYPGADTIEDFAALLREGRDCITEIPSNRLDLLPRYSARKGEPGASYCKWGGFLSHVDRFDAEFFGYSKRAADQADPQERLFLQTVWHLLERAGYTRKALAEHYDKRVGVFVGSMYQQYADLATDPESRALLSLSSYSGIANRTSFFFDLQGPSVAVDSMCSSSLQAVHQACQSLYSGECRLAVAGGVNLSIHPAKYEALSQAGLVGSDPASRAFSGGDGYLPAEGVGAILLKPLEDAVRDGDRVLAVIKGSLANHAGHSAGYAVPNADAQARLLEDAFQSADIDPATIGYVEAAATGSRIGDAIELRALERVYGGGIPDHVPPAIGSVKTNIGHAEAASGMAQLTKVLLQFEHRELFPSFGFRSAEVNSMLAETVFAAQTDLEPWPARVEDGKVQPRRATISSFGAGGSNVHLILQEAPQVSLPHAPVEGRRAHIFPVSARTQEQLAALRKALAVYVRKTDGLSMVALSRTLREGRETFPDQIEIVATDPEELAEKLEKKDYRERADVLAAVGADAQSNSSPMLILPGYPFAQEKHWLSQGHVFGPAFESASHHPPETDMTEQRHEADGEHIETALQLICRVLATELGCTAYDIAPQSEFESLGVDSMIRMRLGYILEEAYGRVVHLQILETHATPQSLAEWIEAGGDKVRVADQVTGATYGAGSKFGPFECPLGEAQKGLWVLQSLYPESSDYNVPLVFKVKSIDSVALEKAVAWLLAEHPILGTCVDQGDGGLALTGRLDTIEVLSRVLPKEIETSLFLRQRMLIPFDLGESVFRIEHISGGKLEADESIVLLVAHHIVTDGVSSSVLTRDLWVAYDHFARSQPGPEWSTSAAYSEFVAWETAFAASNEGQAQKRYWLEKLSGPLPELRLPTDTALNRAAVTVNGQSLEQRLPEGLSAKLLEVAKNQGVSPASLYLTAFSSLLYRYSGERDIIVGVPTLRRPSHRFEETLGYCANMIALRLAIDHKLSFSDLSKSVYRELGAGLRNSDYPFAAIARESGGTITGDTPYQVTFAYQNFASAVPELDIFSRGEVSLLAEFRQVGGAPLGIEIQNDPNGALIIVNYDANQFSDGTIERMLAHLREFLIAASNQQASPISALPMLTPPEMNRAVHHWGKNGRLDVSKIPVHERVLAQAKKTPAAMAVKQGNQQLSYKDLAFRSKQIALSLQKRGIKPGGRIAVFLQQEPDTIAALLAVMRIGAIWVPIDPEYPDERVTHILRDAGVGAVLSRGVLVDRVQNLKDISGHVIDLDQERHGLRSRFAKLPLIDVQMDTPAYIIYTSGSTGVPKGVVVAHGALSGHCQVIAKEYGLSVDDVVLQFAPTAVDTAIEQILPILTKGGRLVLRPAELQTADAFLEFLEKMKITVADLPPGYLHELLRSWDRSGANFSPLALRLMIVGGEALMPEVAAQWNKSGLSRIRLVNAYGPTEATVTALVHTVKPGRHDRNIPIGRPLPGTEVYILDRDGNLVPDGVVGELYLAGERLAIGYHDRHELTEEKFTIRPIGHKSLRLYRTGDLACYRPNSGGLIEFHGRADDQVKIRGHRIELGEIEAEIAACGIAEAVVAVERNKSGDPVLTAYVGAAVESFDEKDIRRRLSVSLPLHMVPSVWLRFDHLPKTNSGKIDRRSLVAPVAAMRSASASVHKPRDQVEEQLLGIWLETLERDPDQERIGIDEDFADLGGHSLLAVRFLSRVEQTFGCSFSVSDLARASTIAEQAQLLRQRGVSGLARTTVEKGRGMSDIPFVVSLRQPELRTQAKNGEPIFLVHPIGGTLTCYQAFVDQLDIDRPIYGIRAKGLEVDEVSRKQSVEDLSAEYCRHVRSVQPQGPYTLCGWSFGGVIAYEMARQLIVAGQEIAFVGVLDSYTPEDAERLEREFGLADIDPQARCQNAFLRDLFGVDVALSPDQDVIETAIALPQFAAVLPGGGPETVTRLFEVFSANYMAFLNYVPKPSDAPITLVRASQGMAEDTGMGWTAVATGALQVCHVAADHYNVLRPPYLDAWVPMVRERLLNGTD